MSLNTFSFDLVPILLAVVLEHRLLIACFSLYLSRGTFSIDSKKTPLAIQTFATLIAFMAETVDRCTISALASLKQKSGFFNFQSFHIHRLVEVSMLFYKMDPKVNSLNQHVTSLSYIIHQIILLICHSSHK